MKGLSLKWVAVSFLGRGTLVEVGWKQTGGGGKSVRAAMPAISQGMGRDGDSGAGGTACTGQDVPCLRFHILTGLQKFIK